MPKYLPQSEGSRLSRFAKGEHKEETIAGTDRKGSSKEKENCQHQHSH